MLIAWVISALVDVIVTVSALEAVRTLGTSECLVAHSVNVTTAAVPKTILAPRAAGTGCMMGGGVHICIYIYNDLVQLELMIQGLTVYIKYAIRSISLFTHFIHIIQ